MRLTEEQVESLPSLTFTLAGGLRLTLPPAAYMDPDPLDQRTRNGTKSYAPRLADSVEVWSIYRKAAMVATTYHSGGRSERGCGSRSVEAVLIFTLG